MGTDRGVTKSLLISEDSALPPKYKVAPSVLWPEVEGPPSVLPIYDGTILKDNVSLYDSVQEGLKH